MVNIAHLGNGRFQNMASAGSTAPPHGGSEPFAAISQECCKQSVVYPAYAALPLLLLHSAFAPPLLTKPVCRRSQT